MHNLPLREGFCQKRIWANRAGGAQCARKAVRDGWCKQHHPDAEKARAVAREAAWKAESEARNQRYREQRAAEAERDRKLALYPELVAALKRCMPFLDDALDAVQVMSEVVLTAECRAAVAEANEVLRKAEGDVHE